MSAKWIRVETDFPDHPKVGHLASLLACSDDTALAIVVRLWSWVSRFCPSGHIADVRGQSAAAACRTSADADKLLLALAAAGFLDVLPDGGWNAHDWAEHQGKVAARAEKDRERKRLARASVLRNVRGQSTDIPRTSAPRPSQRDVTERDVTGRVEEGAGAVAPPPSKPAKITKPPDPRHHPLLQALAEAFEASRGAAMGVDGHTAKAVSNLLAKAEPEEVLRRWRLALAEPRYPKVATPGELASTWNHWAGMRVVPAKPGAPVSAESVDWNREQPGEVLL